MGPEAGGANQAAGWTPLGGPREPGKREAAIPGAQETAGGQEPGPVTEGSTGQAPPTAAKLVWDEPR